MANICENTLVFVSKELDVLEEFHEKFYNSIDKDIYTMLVDNGVDENEASIDSAKRNVIQLVDKSISENEDEYYFSAYTTSAWSSSVSALENYLSNYPISLYYESLELGCDYYVIHDPYRKYLTNDMTLDMSHYDTVLTCSVSNVEELIREVYSEYDDIDLTGLKTYKEVCEKIYSIIDKENDYIRTLRPKYI